METRTSGAASGPEKRTEGKSRNRALARLSIIGKHGKTALATLVERTSRFLVLVPLHGRDALTVGTAVIAATAGLPETLRRSLTWDCGAEMAAHSTVTKGSMPVYFAHPHSPWERGSNENLNRIVREYFPKGVNHLRPDIPRHGRFRHQRPTP